MISRDIHKRLHDNVIRLYFSQDSKTEEYYSRFTDMLALISGRKTYTNQYTWFTGMFDFLEMSEFKKARIELQIDPTVFGEEKDVAKQWPTLYKDGFLFIKEIDVLRDFVDYYEHGFKCQTRDLFFDGKVYE